MESIRQLSCQEPRLIATQPHIYVVCKLLNCEFILLVLQCFLALFIICGRNLIVSFWCHLSETLECWVLYLVFIRRFEDQTIWVVDITSHDTVYSYSFCIPDFAVRENLMVDE